MPDRWMLPLLTASTLVPEIEIDGTVEDEHAVDLIDK